MSTARLLAVLAALVTLELGLFYARHHDLVKLSASRAALVSDARFSDTAGTASPASG